MKNSTTYILLISFLAGVFSTSCKKEKVPIPPEIVEIDSCICEPFPKPAIVFGDPSLYSQYSDSYLNHVEINPNNADEMVYIEGIFPDSRLIYFNNQTKEKRTLFSHNVVGFISWSVKDWVLFQSSSDLNLYKIKSNGDSLFQISNYGLHHGIWNATGDKIMTHDSNNNVYTTRILDENGTEIDSIGIWQHRRGKWNHPQFYLGSSITQIVVMNAENKTIVKKLDFPEQSEVAVMGWVSLDEFWYTNGIKLYSYNLSTNCTKLLRCECYQVYRTFSTNLDFSKKIVTKIVSTYQGNYMTLFESKIISLDNNANELEEIIP